MYKKLYFFLFNGLSDVLALLEAQNYGTARERVMELQQQAEEQYLAGR